MSRAAPGHPRATDPPAVPGILALADFYPPAFRAGGPTRSLPPIVEHLAEEFEFRVITRDRDLGASGQLPGVVPDRWTDFGSARCLYLSPRRRLRGGLLSAIRSAPHDVLYLNSFFSLEFALLPLLLRRLGLVPRRGLVMAPRGELDERALAIKHRRKGLYTRLVRTLRLLDGAIWHAANEAEAQAIGRRFGRQARILIARDIPMRPGADSAPPVKEAGALEVAFLSRISRIKNLDYAITVLTAIRGTVNLSVFGPIEDPLYWDECLRLSRRLPANVTLAYRGLVQPDEILAVLGSHHLLFLPTKAESFGHVIVESLLAGCPVLISDQTPWHDLEARRAGWDLPLAQMDRFRAVIELCVAMTQREFDPWSAGARNLGHEIADDPDRDSAYRAIFRAALPRTAGSPSGPATGQPAQ